MHKLLTLRPSPTANLQFIDYLASEVARAAKPLTEPRLPGSLPFRTPHPHHSRELYNDLRLPALGATSLEICLPPGESLLCRGGSPFAAHLYTKRTGAQPHQSWAHTCTSAYLPVHHVPGSPFPSALDRLGPQGSCAMFPRSYRLDYKNDTGLFVILVLQPGPAGFDVSTSMPFSSASPLRTLDWQSSQRVNYVHHAAAAHAEVHEEGPAEAKIPLLVPQLLVARLAPASDQLTIFAAFVSAAALESSTDVAPRELDPQKLYSGRLDGLCRAMADAGITVTTKRLLAHSLAELPTVVINEAPWFHVTSHPDWFVAPDDKTYDKKAPMLQVNLQPIPATEVADDSDVILTFSPLYRDALELS